MKVLILSNSIKTFFNFRGDLMRELAENGHEVVACVPESDTVVRDDLPAIRMIALYYKRHGTNPLSEYRLIRAYKELLFKEKPDRLLCFTIKPNIYGPIAAKKAGITQVYAVVTGLGNMFIQDGASLSRAVLGRISRWLYARGTRYCEKVIFQNQDDLDEFLRLKIISPAQGVLVHGSGVNMERFFPSPLPNEISFLMISRLIREKGVLEYLNAARMLHKRYPNIKFRLLGGFDSARFAIKKEELAPYVDEGSVEYLGEKEDVRPYIAQTAVAVLPSYREGIPRSLLEAMACGRPIITTDVPGCRQTVRSGQNGILIPPRDAAALADAMERVILNPDLASQMGREGLAYCGERFDIRLINREMLRIMGLSDEKELCKS